MALTQVDQGLLNSYAQYTGFKNRIINGAMGIWQRGTSWSSPSYLTYTADRWFVGGNGISSVAQSSDVPTGFKYSLTTTGTTNQALGQRIESVNCTDLVGQNVTISFWLKQTTGAGSTAANVQLYYPTATDNYTGIIQIGSSVYFDTTSSWARYSVTFTNLPSGAANGLEFFIVSSSASSTTFLVTGAQLEKGSTATSFDYRPYGTELALCQRYYEKSYDINVVAGTATYTGALQGGTGSNNAGSTTYAFECYFVPFQVQKRAAPTVTGYDPQAGTSGSWQRFYTGVSPAGASTVSFDTIGYKGFRAVVAANGNAANCVLGQYTASSEL
jgi:hypothetical protein